jgi:2,3-bisphosphoglycerate-independent phosphoglycerate mutase
LIDLPYLSQLIKKSDSKILLLVLPDIGGASDPLYGRSELDAARVPNLDRIARESAGGLSTPVAHGISPGSVSGNLALLGYDPLKYIIGRGPFEAMGAGLELKPGDIAARGNLALVSGEGVITDRRAGRLSTEEAAPLIDRLREIQVTGVQIEIGHGMGYRFALRLRGEGLSGAVSATDPMTNGVPPNEARAEEKSGAAKSAKAISEWVKKASEALKGREQANAVLLRGWSAPPDLPNFADAYRLTPAAITARPLYQGLAASLGMTLYRSATDFPAHLALLKEHWDEHDFFWVHYKGPGSASEEGDYQAKKHAIERVDEHVHDLLSLHADILVIAGDQASPSSHGGHSWHPVPFVIRSAGTLGGSGIDRFNERDLRQGSLGRFEAKDAMMLILAHAGKLKQFGS